MMQKAQLQLRADFMLALDCCFTFMETGTHWGGDAFCGFTKSVGSLGFRMPVYLCLVMGTTTIYLKMQLLVLRSCHGFPFPLN